MKKKLVSILIILAIFVGSGVLVFGQISNNDIKKFFNEIISFFSTNPGLVIYNNNKDVKIGKYVDYDKVVYIDTAEIINQPKDVWYYILAHEVGHHIQNENGYNYEKSFFTTKRTYELQADCIAGYYLVNNNIKLNKVEYMIDENFEGSETMIGNWLWGDGINWHGGPSERKRAIKRGYSFQYKMNNKKLLENACSIAAMEDLL